MEKHNLECLFKLLTYPPNKMFGINGVNKQQIKKWHHTDFRQNTLGYDRSVWLRPYSKNMTGGGITVEKFFINDKEYIFKVDYTEAEMIKTQYDEEDLESVPLEATVHFLSQLVGQESKNYACIYMIIQQDSRTGLVQGVTNKLLCSGYRVGEKIQLSEKRGQGAILMRALIQYCYKYRDILNIDRLELDDESNYDCNRWVSVDLFHSNILCGKLPYYMQFGFVPVEKDTIKKIMANLEIVRKRLVTVTDFINLTEDPMPDSIRHIVMSNQGKPLTECLHGILFSDCVYYSKIYMEMWRKLKLKKFGPHEKAFELFL